MEIIRTDDFIRALDKSPKEIKRLYATQEQRFSSDWRDSRLHIKKVKTLELAFRFASRAVIARFFIFNPAILLYFLTLTIERMRIDLVPPNYLHLL